MTPARFIPFTLPWLLLAACVAPGAPPAPPGPASPSLPPVSAPPPLAPGEPGPRTLTVELEGDPTQVVLPPGHGPGWQGPALVFFHGHGMDERQLTTRTGLAERAAREGWIAASGLLGSRRHWSNEQALRAAGRLLTTLPARWGVRPDAIYLVGFSMGGGTALLVASNPYDLPYRVAAVASSQGVSDPAALAEPFRQSLRAAYALAPDAPLALPARHSPPAMLERLRGLPLYLEHGTGDEVVPATQTRTLAEGLGALGIPATVAFHEGRRHGEATIDEAAIITFLRAVSAPNDSHVMSQL